MYYPDWNNKIDTSIALLAFFAPLVLVAREFFPETRLNYSKFTSDAKPGLSIPSNYGMLIIYVPSLVASAVYLWISSSSTCLTIIALLNFLHYAKRVYEVLYVHKYSGNSKVKDNVSISFCYAAYVMMVMFYSSQVAPVSIMKFTLGAVLYFVGESMNFYHHNILSQLRKDDSKEYKIPNDGLFKYVWCPHYTGEIISFIAMVLVSQHFIVFLLQVASAAYLATRAYNTRIWYKNKFNGKIPKRACLLPFIF